jgi:hypothetical protein
MSISSKVGGSRASDEDGKTAVKVGMFSPGILPSINPRASAPGLALVLALGQSPSPLVKRS